jgi:hypothetical protein
MAKLEPSYAIRFAAAASALTLTTSRKLIRNFRYYRSDEPGSILSRDLAKLCRGIRRDVFSLYNLMEHDPNSSPFFVSLASEIHDQLEELHRKLLFFDPDQISEIIPLIDHQRTFWNRLSEQNFYNNELSGSLEKEIPNFLTEIENKINLLPEKVTI